ncbi:hypothetical protein H0H87_008844, partial [Tephrocybe sp. NHM501043]
MDEGNYALLGLSSDASLPEIKQAYRKMALKWHPDRHTMAEDKEHAKNVFGEMTTTYQALIRDRELASLTTKQFKARTRLPTPILTPGPPLPTLGVGGLGEWAYSLRLTLEDLFHGKRCRFYVVRHLLSGRTKNVIIEIDVPSGCRRGTRILCRGVGHELPNGTLQDVTFIVEEAPHVRFSRIEDDLYLDMRLPWTDRFTQRPERVGVRGIDGEEIILIIDYMQHKMLQGEVCVKGAGMAVRNKGQVVGRSDLIIR